MPVHTLLHALESALVGLFGESKLSSCRISGGKHYASVTLKFQIMLDITDPGVPGVVIGICSYRLSPPSQVARDTQRRDRWQAQRHQDNMPGNTLKIDIPKENVL